MPRPSEPRRRATPRSGLWRDRRAATAVEYGLIVSLVVIAMIASFVEVADVTRGMWNNISSSVTNAR